MSTKLLVATMSVAILCTAAFAGDMQKGEAGKMPMEAMKAEMMKCYVCKHFAARWDEIGPMGMESIKLNDGLIMNNWVKSEDPKKIAAFHAASEECNVAGGEMMGWTDERAKGGELCEWCQEVRTAVKSGAHMSMGKTKSGDMKVLTATDPAAQAKLAALHEKCVMMASMMEKPAAPATAHKE